MSVVGRRGLRSINSERQTGSSWVCFWQTTSSHRSLMQKKRCWEELFWSTVWEELLKKKCFRRPGSEKDIADVGHPGHPGHPEKKQPSSSVQRRPSAKLWCQSDWRLKDLAAGDYSEKAYSYYTAGIQKRSVQWRETVTTTSDGRLISTIGCGSGSGPTRA